VTLYTTVLLVGGRTVAKKEFYDPFMGWGKLAQLFCACFAFFLPNLFFMMYVLDWFQRAA
jgi:hypothetical protein